MIDYTDRIVSSFDPELGFSVDRNVGDVDMHGFEAQIGQRLGSAVSLSGSVGYAKSELLENLTFGPNQLGQQQLLPLAGKELVETPEWTFALRADYEVTENFHIGLQGKNTSERFSTDLNDETTPAYTVFDLDASYEFELGGFESAGLQFNVTNITRRRLLRHDQLEHRRQPAVHQHGHGRDRAVRELGGHRADGWSRLLLDRSTAHRDAFVQVELLSVAPACAGRFSPF